MYLIRLNPSFTIKILEIKYFEIIIQEEGLKKYSKVASLCICLHNNTVRNEFLM